MQIEDKRPTFCIKELPSLADVAGRSGRDLIIVRLDKKKDHRELQTTSGGNMFTFKAGIGKDRLPDITTKTVSDGVFVVTPNEDLKPGEYMLTFAALGSSNNGGCQDIWLGFLISDQNRNRGHHAWNKSSSASTPS